MKIIKNKIALLTGASSGLGAVIAKALSFEGVEIVGVARSEEGLQKTKIEIENNGGKFHSVSFDLSDLSNILELKNKVESIIGKIDILINNAGITKDKLLLRLTESDLKKI